MLTRLTVRNFKLFDEVVIELGNPVVLIGPNDSGKTSALQALVLWEQGVKRWAEKRAGRSAPEKRSGVTITRKDLASLPISSARLLWRNLAVRRGERDAAGKQHTSNILFEIVVDGITEGEAWSCGMEFDYANEEAFYCRPLKTAGAGRARPQVPDQAVKVQVAFLPPMSGLSAEETRLPPGRVNVLIGEGRTAQVLRNLCYQIVTDHPDGHRRWESVSRRMEELFGVQIEEPRFVEERGEITMSYRTRSGVTLDLPSSGRGMQQTLLLLAYLSAHPGAVLLLDEPDAHLEILRQRQIYHILSDTAEEHRSQIVAASHSEVVLNEAAGRDTVVAFVGKPHRIDNRGSQVLKSLKDIGFEDYYSAEQTGWVLYLEGSTDLAILRAFAEKLQHPARDLLERPFAHYVGREPGSCCEHFFGLREAIPHLQGCAIFDRLSVSLERKAGLRQVMWKRREIENYLCQRQVLVDWARAVGEETGPLFGSAWPELMEKCIGRVQAAMADLGKGSPWSEDTKVSDDFLDPLFDMFYRELSLPNLMRKSGYHQLARFVSAESLPGEIVEVLDLVSAAAGDARV
jgi:hypothetical protein